MSSIWRKTIIAAIAYLVVFIAIIIFALSPSIASLKQNKQKMAENQSKLNETYDKLNSLQKTNKHPEELKSAEDTVNKSWPDNSDISQFIVQTEGLAKSNSLILENLSIEESKKQKVASSTDDKDSAKKKNTAPTGTQFTFSLKAPYSSILNFLKGMETLPRFNSLSLINLSGNEDATISVRLTGNIYYGK
ncbi:MAG: hypothetical protein M1324_02375 [Patescibacteria group bacterium]|nr:hypothetical protein [Patescibacteria group bacterium]